MLQKITKKLHFKFQHKNILKRVYIYIGSFNTKIPKIRNSLFLKLQAVLIQKASAFKQVKSKLSATLAIFKHCGLKGLTAVQAVIYIIAITLQAIQQSTLQLIALLRSYARRIIRKAKEGGRFAGLAGDLHSATRRGVHGRGWLYIIPHSYFLGLSWK
jgi:hypothetical protein